ncbi:MAG: TAT-variant-translocated molybdopterin oxidoreductase [Acidobacteriota bacterium]
MSPVTGEQGKAYWRSLERLLDSPSVSGGLAEEFAPGAAEPPDGMTRRTMMGLMGASLALAGLSSCRRPVEEMVPFANPPETMLPGIPRQYATTMPLGTSAYGLLVVSHEGRPVKIEGNPLHPSSRGAAGSWMQAAVLDLYDPDRSRGVLRRSGGKRSSSSWAAFLSFWTQRAAAAERTGGAGLALLSEAYSSPTMDRLSAAFKKRFPRAQWVVHEPAGDASLFEGLRRATGTPLRPVAHLDQARTILSLDADFLMAESDSLACARGFAAGRRVGSVRDRMNRLYVIESAFSLTGAAADHRLALPSRQIGSVAAALALHLRALGLPVDLPGDLARPPVPAALGERLAVMARDLAASRGAALVMAGRRQPPAVHALVAALNQALDGWGRTVSFHRLLDAAWAKAGAIDDLVAAMHAGTISTLIMVGGNPVHTVPGHLRFAQALGKVEQSVHLSPRLDETSHLVGWHLPRSHFLEAWGDARAAEGTISLVQPLIRPLFQSRSDIELLALLVRDADIHGLQTVRETWLASVLGNTNFEGRWNRALHDGRLADSAPGAVKPRLRPQAIREAFEEAARPADGTGLEIVFQVSHAVHDGRYANNGWLQELPDPITKITWDNAALLGPETAADLGVKTGEVLSLTLGGSRLEAPACVVPGQAEGSVALALGYGRTAVGRVGNGVGTDAYRLRPGGSLWATGLRAERTGRTHPLSLTQEHGRMERRDLIREATLAAYRSGDGPAPANEKKGVPLPLWRQRTYKTGYQWGMAIDLNACIGCNACMTACQAENNVPIVGAEQVRRGREMHWLRIDRYFSGAPEDPSIRFQPVPCMQCENAPCEEVCPVGATVHDQEGLNAQVYNRCIGTRYCSNNCAYKVRHFNFFNYTKDLPDLMRLAMNPDVTIRSRGVMEKCTYCVQRIHQGKRDAKGEGRAVRDGEIRPACQQTCPTGAIVFGNLNDPESQVVRLKSQNRNYTLLDELDTRPRTSYLARLHNPNPRWPGRKGA